jgi:hypothetical protein
VQEGVELKAGALPWEAQVLVVKLPASYPAPQVAVHVAPYAIGVLHAGDQPSPATLDKLGAGHSTGVQLLGAEAKPGAVLCVLQAFVAYEAET